jgi:flagellar protein FlgJ
MTAVFSATDGIILSDGDMATKREQVEFVKAVYPAAKALREKRDSIHPVFVTAQAALETGWKLKGADGTNNLFGITRGSRWTGEVKLCRTTEYFEKPDKRFTAPERVVDVKPAGDRFEYDVYRLFRVYGSPEECLDDHLSVLRGSGYADAWPYRDDPREFARRISDSAGARYATSPAYVGTMHQVIGSVERIAGELGL